MNILMIVIISPKKATKSINSLVIFTNKLNFAFQSLKQ